MAIVTVNTSVQNAPAPSTLQATGALISQGGTTAAEGTLTLLPNANALAALLPNTIATSTIALSTPAAGTATVTLASAHGWTVGDTIPVTISGATPVAYNGTYQATVTTTTAFTIPFALSPGSVTVAPLVALGDVTELAAMAATFFAQNTGQAVYVLELGEGTTAEGLTSLTAWLAANPGRIYAMLVPREWDGITALHTLASTYATPSSKLYFYVTTIIANRNFYSGLKSVYAGVEAPGLPAGEFSLAATFAAALASAPSSTSRVPPMSYRFLYGVTAYPSAGNQAIFTELGTANVSYVASAAEGGLTENMVSQGNFADGNPWNYWFAADWAQINLDLTMANEVINGSNTTINPLYYNQPGINRLKNRGIQTLQQAVAAGLGIGTVVGTALPQATFVTNYNAGEYEGQIVLNAEPFLINQQENPSTYAEGIYNGFTAVFTPLRGFASIVFNLAVTNFIAAA